MSIETMKQWLEALELSHPRFGVGTAIHIKAVASLRQAIEQAQEPVAWIEHHKAGDNLVWDEPHKGTPLYTSPPPRQWVGMTEDEVDQGLLKTGYAMKTAEAWRHGVEWAQFNLMRKNT